MINSMDTRQHYKMYKKGKQWLVAGIVTLGLGVGVIDQQASAATTSETAEDEAVKTVPVTAPEMAGEVPLKNTPQADPKTNVEPEQPAETDPDQEEPDSDKVLTAVKAEAVRSQSTKMKAVSAKERVVRSVKPAAVAVTPAPKVALRADESVDVWLPNRTLQTSVLFALRDDFSDHKTWTSAADITKDDMALLTRIGVTGANDSDFQDTYIDGKTPFSLKGLEYAINLERLDLKSNLNASTQYYGDVRDLSPIAGLTKLTYLDVSGNRISDITPLKNLTNLDYLDLQYNSILDFSSLKDRQFGDLHVENQYVILPSIRVNKQTRSAVLPALYTDENGKKHNLSSASKWRVPVQKLKDGTLYSYMYYRGGARTLNADGSITYDDILDQEPGTSGTSDILPQQDKYFLIGVVNADSEGKSRRLQMFQPYVMADEAAPVIISYQDQSGKTLAPDVTLDPGLIGDNYTTTPATIDGYTLKTTPENAMGMYSKDPIHVVYIYESKVTPPVVTPVQEVTVTVHYQTSDGKTVAADTVVSGKPGMTYSTQPVVVDGYELVTMPDNAAGTFGETDVEITYIYAVQGGDGDLIDPDDPDVTEPDDGGHNLDKGGQSDTVTDASKPALDGTRPSLATATQPAKAQTRLPQTDERPAASWLGLAVLGSLLGLAAFGLRRKKF